MIEYENISRLYLPDDVFGHFQTYACVVFKKSVYVSKKSVQVTILS